MSGVSLPGLSVAISSVGVSLIGTTANLWFAGESLFGVGVSLVTGIVTVAPPAIPGKLIFNSTTNTQYLPVLIGFM